jgi:diguanylate cyclase (GGDEF)-like protein
MTDYLTGVYHRYSGEKRLREDISRAERSGKEISLVMLDIDEFKLINDRYGHDVGDICLKHVVKIIQTNIRKGDWLVRWGGDEFILILFDSDEKSSERIVERIGIAVREQPALTPKGEISMSLSVGMCQHNGKDDAQELFKKADSALLSAKRLGKS